MRSCLHFLVDSELERARYKVFNYAVETLNETIVKEKLDYFFNKATVNLPFRIILKEKEDGGFRYFNAHENSTLLDRFKPVCTHDDLAKLKDLLKKTDVMQSCSRERMNTKWRFYKLTNLTVFAASLKDVPMGARTQSYPNLCSKITQSTVSILKRTQDNQKMTTCVFSVLLISTCTEINDEEKIWKLFSLFINKMDGLNADQFQGVHMNDILFVEDLLIPNILL